MTQIDQFESVFKSASKLRYELRPIPLHRVVLVTDLDAGEEQALAGGLARFLGSESQEPEVITVPGEQTRTVEQLLDMVARIRPHAVATYRNVHSAAWQWPHSLGRHLDVLSQATEQPVLVIPHPKEMDWIGSCRHRPSRVMAVTDHLAGDGRLVNYGLALTEPGGILFLTHVEDDAVFERYMNVISKIPSIDTDNARKTILRQLLKEPREYVESCRRALADAGMGIEVRAVIGTGHRLTEYRQLVAEHAVELVVMHTNDEDQLAMHGLAYPLAVELRRTPLLLV